MRLFALCCALLCGFPHASAPGQEGGFPWHLYEARTLADVVEENAEDALKYKEHGQIVLTAGRPYKVKVVYKGEARPVRAERRALIEMWLKTYEIDPKFLSLFESEHLFKEGEKEFWLPAQTPVAAHFPRELNKGETVELYVQFIGGRREKDSDGIDWLFLVNEFQVIKARR